MSKSIRLNKDIRKQIIDNIREAYLAENTKPVVNDVRESSLHKAILDHYKLINKDIIEFYETNPEKQKFIHTNYYCRIREEDSSHFYLNFNLGEGDNVCLPSSTDSNIFMDFNNPDTKVPKSISKVIASNKKLNKAMRKEREALSAYEAELTKYTQSVRQVLDGVNTSKQLMEVWPEVEKFLPQGVTNPSKINLPAVSIAGLNSKLGSA